MNKTLIAQLRKNHGLTQEQLAEKSGLTARTIQRLEAGSDVSLDTLSAVATALNVNISELFQTIDDKDKESEIMELDQDRLLQIRWRKVTGQLYHLLPVLGILLFQAVFGYWIGTLPDNGWMQMIFGSIWLACWPILFISLGILRTLVLDPKLDKKYPLTKGISFKHQ